MKDPADDGAAHRTYSQDRNVRLGDDCIGHTDENGNGESRAPTDPPGINQSNADADSEPVGKSTGDGGALVRELHGQHDSDRHQAENDSAQHSKMRSGHGGTDYIATCVL